MFSDLQSKLNRAIRAVIIDQGAGSDADTFVDFTSDNRELPNTTIDCGEASEHIPFTGNWRFPRVAIVLRDHAAIQPEEINTDAAWRAAMERYDKVRVALSRVGDSGEFDFMPGQLTTLGRALSVDDPENHADMEDFTVFWWNIVTLAAPRLSPDGNFFESGLQFDAIACNANF